MYKVYLVGIIDDHSRYLVGWGLFRQQTLASVMEVVKGAIGFASQTSASNLISGLFLIAERSFVVGDVITIEEQTGEVYSPRFVTLTRFFNIV